MNNEQLWANFKTQALKFGGIIGWVIGAIFSYMGFVSESTGNWFWVCLGIGLTGLVTILELWLNGTNTSDLFSNKSTFGDVLLFLGGCLSYVYDSYTNILGLCVLMLGIAKPDLAKLGWSQLVIPVITGIFLAALPEPMFVTALKQENKKKKEQQVQNTNNQPKKKIPYQAQHKPALGPVRPAMPSYHLVGMSAQQWPPKTNTYMEAVERGEE